MDPVHESGPWTPSKVGVHGPLVLVLSSPVTVWFSLLLFYMLKHSALKEGPHHYDWNIGKCRHLDYSTCSRRLSRCGKFRHTLIQTYLLLATKPNYTRGRVGCPSDTRPLKTNSNASLR